MLKLHFETDPTIRELLQVLGSSSVDSDDTVLIRVGSAEFEIQVPVELADHQIGVVFSVTATNRVAGMLAGMLNPVVFPATISACLVSPRQTEGIIFRRKRLLAASSTEHNWPLWRWLIHANHSGQRMIPISIPANATKSVSSLPPLLPADAAHSPIAWFAEVVERLPQPQEITSRTDWTAMKAGLLQWHGFLEASHHCAQSIEGQGREHLGDYWHAIMHRREPDSGNAKYWFRRVGVHPIHAELATLAKSIIPADSRWKSRLVGGGAWDSFAFVDFCEAAANEPTLRQLAETLQAVEMLLLLVSG